MELRHIYQVANAIRNYVKDYIPKDENAPIDSEIDGMPIEVSLEDMVVNVKVSPSTHYGIDKEFYRQTHDNSTKGFEHNKAPIAATIDGVKFLIISKEEGLKQPLT